MSGWPNAVEENILKWWFAAFAYTPAPTHLGLYTTLPNEAGAGGVEVSGGAYAREAYARNSTNWGSSTGADPSTIQNLVAVTYTEATASWGTVLGWGYFDAATAGNMIAFGAVSPTKQIDTGDTAEFAAGGLVFKLGDPGDSY